MTKYDEQFKLAVVQAYLSGDIGIKALAHSHGLAPGHVQMWVDGYLAHGAAGLVRRGSSYSAAFKLQVLQRMWREHWSLRQTAAKFDIRSIGHISRWERQYHEGGLPALERRRRAPNAMSDKPPKPIEPAVQEPRTLEQVLKENEYLRAENAYLKKLDALIQQKRAAARKKRG